MRRQFYLAMQRFHIANATAIANANAYANTHVDANGGINAAVQVVVVSRVCVRPVSVIGTIVVIVVGFAPILAKEYPHQRQVSAKVPTPASGGH